SEPVAGARTRGRLLDPRAAAGRSVGQRGLAAHVHSTRPVLHVSDSGAGAAAPRSREVSSGDGTRIMIDPREIAALEAARDAGDDAADAVVAALGRSAWAINALLKHVERDDQPFPAAVPDAVRALVAAPDRKSTRLNSS